MPVQNVSVLDSSWSKGGGSRWIDQRSLMSSSVSVDVQRLAEGVEHVALGDVADRHGDRRAGVGHLGAAHQTVGRLQGDGAHHVVADVLGDLEGQRLGELTELDLDGQRVEERGNRVAAELHVDHGADHADDAAGGRARRRGRRCLRRRVSSSLFVTPCCGERVGAADDLADFLGDLGLASLVGQPGVGPISSVALSLADFIARRRAADSDAADSSSAEKIRALM